jgi:phosphopantetheinyl transferase
MTPTKHWKMTVEDIRNRAHRRDYLAALDDMFALTSTAAAPWYVVPAEYKWFARIATAKTAVKILGKGITLGPPALDPEVVRAAAEILGREEMAALGLARPERGEK